MPKGYPKKRKVPFETTKPKDCQRIHIPKREKGVSDYDDFRREKKNGDESRY